MKKGLIYSAVILSIGSIFAKFVGIFLKIPLVNIIGDYGMGLYQLPYPIYTTLLTFSMTGFSLSVSRLISSYYSRSEYYVVLRVLKLSLFLISLFSLILTFFYIFLGNLIIKIFKWPPDSYYPYISLAPAIFIVSVQSVFRGYFNGLKDMNTTSISQIIESVFRVGSGLFLCNILLSYGLNLSVAGALLGASIGGIFSLCYLIFSYRRRKSLEIKMINSSFKRSLHQNFNILKELILNTFYFSFSSLLISFISIEDSFLYPYFMNIKNHSYKETSELFGIFSGKVMTLIHVPLTFSVSMAVALISYISSSVLKVEREKIVKQSFEYVLIINIPAIFAFIFFPKEIMNLIFFKNSAGSQLLRIASVLALIISIVQISNSILQGINRFYVPIKNIALAIVLKIVFMFVLIVIYDLSIIGCVFSNIFCYLIICVLNLIELKIMDYEFFDMQKFIYIIISSVIMIITGIAVNKYIYINSIFVKYIALVFFCMCAYVLSITLFGLINMGKIKKFIMR